MAVVDWPLSAPRLPGSSSRRPAIEGVLLDPRNHDPEIGQMNVCRAGFNHAGQPREEDGVVKVQRP